MTDRTQAVDRLVDTFAGPQPTARDRLHAALEVADIARQRAYQTSVKLREDGSATWAQIADLLQIPWSEEYVRAERAYKLALGPDLEPDRWRHRNLYWTCGGPLGCGQFITDHGPNGHPYDNESGHADGCQREAAEIAAWEAHREDQERRAKVMDEAWKRLAGDGFGLETVKRARWVQAHGGRYQGWSTSERLAVALVLRDDDALENTGYPTRQRALERVCGGWPSDQDPQQWLALVRAAATGDAADWEREVTDAV